MTESQPTPTPSAPTPTAPAAPAAPVTPAAPAAPKPAAREVPMDPKAAAEAAQWGRVDSDGAVWVREASGERQVGQFPDADVDEALAFYVRRYLDLVAQVKLFESRLGHISPKEIDQALTTLKDQVEQPAAVGDMDALRRSFALAEERAVARKAQIQVERQAAREEALATRTAIVEAAEAVAAQDTARTQWKNSAEELRSLLDQWKAAQRGGPRVEKSKEDELWRRFAKARATFDKNRRAYFAEMDAQQDRVKKVKEGLIARAEALQASTDWGATSAEFRELMNQWKAAGRARRKDDDALWERFRAAQQAFFDARDTQNKAIYAEYGQNLQAKLEVLTQAEALLPITDVKAARSQLRALQDKWEAIGRVPRADVARVEGRMRAVEQAVRDAEDAEWRRTNPETRARVEGATSQLEAAIAALEEDLAAAQAAKDAKKIKDVEEALAARRAWLEQIQRSL